MPGAATARRSLWFAPSLTCLLAALRRETENGRVSPEDEAEAQPLDEAWPIFCLDTCGDREQPATATPGLHARDVTMIVCQSWVTALFRRRRVSPFQQSLI